ncbi:MAG: proline--tRNA ligase [Candidatus Thermoplasmatota archaeon]|nr:proline--tRNA ligase [Candidatus Thermoplasmatota archaeon]
MENKKENFNEWYNEIVEISGLSDKRYPIKGMNVWLPYGLKAMQNIDGAIRKSVDSREFQEVSFPVLITRDQLSVEFEHVKGFENEVYWVTRGGMDQLDVEMALRPTSEAAMYGMFSLWVRSHADLPLRTYQIVNVYRYETKHTRTFIRIREIHFFEAHTAHDSYEDSERQMDQYLEIWKEISSELCLPYLVNERPEWDKFPGAMYTLAFDTVVPGGRSLQIGTIHEYGTNFSRNYDIKYLKDDGTHEYASQTTFGLSERLLAAVISLHGDDQGLIFPPGIAPVQVVVVPIPSKRVDTAIYASSIVRNLQEAGFRARIDQRENYTPGFKYNEWEMKGVPLRLEVGEKEVDDNFVTAAPRTAKKKTRIPLSGIDAMVPQLLAEVKLELTKRAADQFTGLQNRIRKVEDIKKANGIVLAGWCGKKNCAEKIEETYEFGTLGFSRNHKETTKCVICNDDGRIGVFSKSY